MGIPRGGPTHTQPNMCLHQDASRLLESRFFQVCMNTQRTTSFVCSPSKKRVESPMIMNEGGKSVPRNKFITEMGGRISSSFLVGSVVQETPHS